MVETHGLTHISLAVCDPQRSLEFYTQLFGVREYFRDETQVQVQGPGPFDVLAFERNPAVAGSPGGIAHFGFRLKKPEDIAVAVAEAERAGGKVLRQGEFSPGFPFAYVADRKFKALFTPPPRERPPSAPTVPRCSPCGGARPQAAGGPHRWPAGRQRRSRRTGQRRAGARAGSPDGAAGEAGRGACAGGVRGV